MTQSNKKSGSSFLLTTVVLLSLFLVTFLLMAIVAKAYMNRMVYVVPGEPQNAYMIHIAEGGLFREQTLCNENDCLLLKIPGKTGKDALFLEVGGQRYFKTEKTFGAEITATGVYCKGLVDINRCMVVTVEGNKCPNKVTYFTFPFSLVSESCLVR